VRAESPSRGRKALEAKSKKIKGHMLRLNGDQIEIDLEALNYTETDPTCDGICVEEKSR
jgi:hypothetical protein